ncbi:unnamed protein product [Durusdinium trenchii]|uniref:J domain-containing protein n=1 Tax=Durusdinium trenchii TaxID=1381693 RepID=A0ABP0KJP7_9DINO
MAKRKLEENAVTACCDEGKAKKRHRKFWTPEERGKVRPWVAELMILSDIDSNKRGGAQWFKEQRKKVLSMAPEEWRQRIQDIKFKANTKTVHGASADELIEEIEPAFRSTASPAVPPDRKASTAAPPPAAPATPACSVPAPVQNRSPHSSREPAGRGIERYFNVKCSLAVAVAPRPHPKRLSLHAGPGRDHYAVLRLHKSCSMQQVHAAYKQRALETHPDKGGSHDEFLAVKEAFEILSDYAKRAQLDGQAFAYERPSQSPDYTRFLLSELLLKKLPKELLTHVDLPTLRALKSLLAEMRDRQRTEGRRRLEPVQKKGNGLVKCANGDYLVTISWNNFRLQVSHIKDLQMATNIHSVT